MSDRTDKVAQAKAMTEAALDLSRSSGLTFEAAHGSLLRLTGLLEERDAAVARAEAAEAAVERVRALVKEWADADEGYTGEAAYFARRHATHLRAALADPTPD